MRRNHVLSLLFIVVLAVGASGATAAAGYSPALGLDLQGGASVVLRPDRDVSDDILNQSIGIIRNRVDALGVAEPDISRQGENIIVQLPGVKDQERALAIVGQTAELRFRPVLQVLPPDGTTATTTTSTTPSTTAPPGDAAATTTTVAPPADPAAATTTTSAPPAAGDVPTTPPEENRADAEVVLPQVVDGDVQARYVLAPAELTGAAVKTARASFNPTGGQWAVDFELTGEGGREFDELAARLVGQPPPMNQLAIELDGVVKSAPTIQEANFGGRGVISGDFSEREAKDLALVLRYGALPVELEPQAIERVSATLGKDSLQAGILAGVIGLALVLLYMILYYRALGLVVLVGLGLTGLLMWGIIAYLGEKHGLALSLAGATGIIVSVGVTVDSYVVYFERLKDEIRAGKTVRSSVDRSFSRAFRTIFAANFASFIGAALLYMLTVGPVRGFAFFLGLSTVLDIFVAFFFTRPAVILLGRSRTFTQARFLGVARGLGALRPETV